MDRTITIKGVGRYEAKPDTVELGMTLKAKKSDYKMAVEQEAGKYEHLLRAIQECGFKAEDLKTTYYRVSPAQRYENGSYVNEGWECSHSVILRFPLDTEKLAELCSVITKCLSEPNLNINFTVKDTEAAQCILLKNAAADAKIKAQMLADASDVKLGLLQRIDYSWSDINFYSRMEIAEESVICSPCISYTPDNIDLEENVTFVWSIE